MNCCPLCGWRLGGFEVSVFPDCQARILAAFGPLVPTCCLLTVSGAKNRDLARAVFNRQRESSIGPRSLDCSLAALLARWGETATRIVCIVERQFRSLRRTIRESVRESNP